MSRIYTRPTQYIRLTGVLCPCGKDVYYCGGQKGHNFSKIEQDKLMAAGGNGDSARNGHPPMCSHAGCGHFEHVGGHCEAAAWCHQKALANHTPLQCTSHVRLKQIGVAEFPCSTKNCQRTFTVYQDSPPDHDLICHVCSSNVAEREFQEHAAAPIRPVPPRRFPHRRH